MRIFLGILCVLSAFADFRTLPEGEAQAFRALYGTSDMQKLTEIEDNPKAYWHQRAEYLTKGEHRTLSHLEFCERFAQEAKECIAQHLAEQSLTLEHEWDEDAIERAIREVAPEESPLFPNVRAMFYADLCDKTMSADPDYLGYFTQAEQVRESLEYCKELLPMVTHDFNKKVRWQILPDGQFSIFDSLVMSSQGFFLCAAPLAFSDRLNFKAHGRSFSGWFGIFRHDFVTHAQRQYAMEAALKEKRVSRQDIFDSCCNPEALTVGNITILSQQIQGWFYQFHELPSTRSFYWDDLFSLVFPKADDLVDDGFRKITPYFMYVDAGYDWRHEPLFKARANSDEVHTFLELLAWSYCWPAVRFLPTSAVWDYINRACRDNFSGYNYLKFMGYAGHDQLLTSVMHILQGLEKNTPQEDHAIEMTKKFQGALQDLIGEKKGGYVIRAPRLACFRLLVGAKQELMQLRDNGITVRFAKKKTLRREGIFNAAGKRLWTMRCDKVK